MIAERNPCKSLMGTVGKMESSASFKKASDCINTENPEKEIEKAARLAAIEGESERISSAAEMALPISKREAKKADKNGSLMRDDRIPSKI